MSSLRIRLSLIFIGVVLFVGMVPFLVGWLRQWLGVSFFDQGAAIVADLPPETISQLQATVARTLQRQLLQFSLTAVVVGISAGILAARTLTAPLHRLVEGARAIGARDLNHRVQIDRRESEEFAAVAAAFNDMAHDLQRAESLRQNLLADVAHELRTPLSVIQGNLRAMLDEVYPVNEEEIARLYDQTRHLTQLVDDLRELAQAEARRLQLDLERVNTVQLVKGVGAAFRPVAERAGLQLRVELLGAVPDILADASRLTQSLHNLLSNALNHTTCEGVITMQVEQVSNEVQIRVSDTGAGIGQEDLPHVFDRFYRTDKARGRDRGGTGLGLAIVKAISEAHGGSVDVRSKGIGQGATFTLHLPHASNRNGQRS